jgi:hypothetical protein
MRWLSSIRHPSSAPSRGTRNSDCASSRCSRAMETGRLRFAVTTITIAEVLTGPFQAGDDALAQRYRAILESWQPVALDLDIAASAARLRASLRLKLADAVRAASAFWRLVTSFSHSPPASLHAARYPIRILQNDLRVIVGRKRANFVQQKRPTFRHTFRKFLGNAKNLDWQ